ncbi:MAG: translation initiation factor IF-2 [Bdellovibrionales bacterium]
MTDTDKKEEEKKEEPKKKLGLGTLSLGSAATAKAKQSIGGGVAVEIRRSRKATPAPTPSTESMTTPGGNKEVQEHDDRIKALQQAIEDEKKRQVEAQEEAKKSAQSESKAEEAPKKSAREIELEELKRIEELEKEKAEEESKRRAAQIDKFKNAPVLPTGRNNAPLGGAPSDDEGTSYRDRMKKAPAARRGGQSQRRGGKMTVTQVLNEDYTRGERGQSMAAIKRARAKAKAALGPQEPAKKVSREVILPENITVQELANRMTEKGGDVIKKLMEMGVMATINQTIDADTAELIIGEFGHTLRRVTEADVEIGLDDNREADDEADLMARPPVVTIMGHVDHGKTSLLDAMRQTDVVAGEAGGITQHIGAYQITGQTGGGKITFLDTPGHAAFTEMRARGANVTDIVVIVIAANDSIMPQTIEAINHAKAANVPMIIAINKIDLPDANVNKAKQDLLQHEVIIEDMGGEVLCVEVSAKKKLNLDKLEEAIFLQSEILDLKANPNRQARGTVVESKLEQGRGSVATILMQNGTLNIGDIFVVGSEWGRVRALINDKGQQVKTAIPGEPVEVLGLNGTPEAGDPFAVVENEAKAREVVEYRTRKKLEKKSAMANNASSLESMMASVKEGEKKTLPVLIKGDVHGSVEALLGSLEKLTEDNEEIAVQALHTGVGGITESDVTLANASGAVIIGFNVRANAQARDLAKRDGVDIRYYNIIYNVIDDIKAILSGMLSPIEREEYLGQAEIREVFNITKVGKIAGCMMTIGMVKRGAKVRLLRDDVVIHEGMLKTLKRFKDEVKEVKEGMECGMAFENYDDIKEGDIIECFELIEEQRELD